MKGEYPNVAIRPNVATLAREWFGSAVSVIPPAGDGYYGESRYGDRRYKGHSLARVATEDESPDALLVTNPLRYSGGACVPVPIARSCTNTGPANVVGDCAYAEVQDELRLTGTKLNGFLPLLKKSMALVARKDPAGGKTT